MSNLKPLLDNVLVRPLEGETTTASGIVLPDSISKEKPMKGEVLAIGPGKDGNVLQDVQVGDTVVFTKYAPTEIKVDGVELYLMGFDSLLAVEG